MPDQVGSTAVSIDLYSRKIIPPQITYPPFVGAVRYALSQGIIIEPYLYVTIRKSGIATTSQLHKIFRINLEYPERGWEYLANSDYNRFAASESANHHGSSVGIIGGTKFAYYATHSAVSGGSTTSFVSALYDLELMTGWNSGTIRGVCSSGSPSYQTNVGWFIDCPERGTVYMHLATGDEGAALSGLWCYNTMQVLPRNNLTSNFWLTATSSYAWGRKAPINWNGDIYLLSGCRNDGGAAGSQSGCGWGTLSYFSGTGTYYTTGTLRYNGGTNTWTNDPIPALPQYQFDAGTTVLARGNIIYTLRPNVNLRHYYDLRWGNSGTWTAFPLPDSTGDHNCSLTYDASRNCLWYVNFDGILQRLDLTDAGLPRSSNWESYINMALLGTVQLNVPDIPFDTSLSSADRFQTATIVDVPFVIESVGARITSHPQVGTANATFLISSTIAGGLGSIGVGTPNADIVIETAGTYDSVVASTITFVIESSSSGSVVVNSIQTSEITDHEFFIESECVVFNNIIGSATSEFEIYSVGTLLVGILGLNATASFTIETDARLLVSPVGSGTANIIISASGNGITGNVGYGAADILIESLAYTYTSIINRNAVDSSFVVVANGSAIVGINGQNIDIPFVIDSNGSIKIGLINTEVSDAPFVVESLAAGAANAVAEGLATFIIDQLNAYGQLYTAPVGGTLVKTTDEIDAWIVNGQSGGHAAFTSYQFNGFFKLGNTYYATSEEGLYRLDVNDDNGAQIDGYVATPVSDFGDRRLKSVSDAYVNMRTDGSIEFRVIVDERTDRLGYRIDIAEGHGLKRRRKKLHKGVKGTNWQVEFKNADGSHTEVASIDIAPDILKRTV